MQNIFVLSHPKTQVFWFCSVQQHVWKDRCFQSNMTELWEFPKTAELNENPKGQHLMIRLMTCPHKKKGSLLQTHPEPNLLAASSGRDGTAVEYGRERNKKVWKLSVCKIVFVVWCFASWRSQQIYVQWVSFWKLLIKRCILFLSDEWIVTVIDFPNVIRYYIWGFWDLGSEIHTVERVRKHQLILTLELVSNLKIIYLNLFFLCKITCGNSYSIK